METPQNETFRDSIGTINEEGKRSWVYPKKPSGKYYKYRKYVSYFLLAFLFSAVDHVKIGCARPATWGCPPIHICRAQ